MLIYLFSISPMGEGWFCLSSLYLCDAYVYGVLVSLCELDPSPLCLYACLVVRLRFCAPIWVRVALPGLI
jgi:hypothetical protein